MYKYIPCFDPDRPETPESVDENVFDIVVNNTTRQVHYDDDGAFIVKMNGVVCERDLSDQQWDDVTAQVLERM